MSTGRSDHMKTISCSPILHMRWIVPDRRDAKRSGAWLMRSEMMYRLPHSPKAEIYRSVVVKKKKKIGK